MKIRYYGHFQQQTGYGHAAMEFAYALDRVSELELRPLGAGGDEWKDASPALADVFRPIAAPDAVIVHTLPIDCPRVLEIDGLRRGAGPKLVAYTWEALYMPRTIAASLYDRFDEAWVPSAVTALALDENYQDRTDSRTLVIPHCYDPYAMLAPGVASRYTREAQLPRKHEHDRFRFYWIGAWSARKNPLGLIRSFALAFGPRDPVELVMHSPGTTLNTFVSALASTGLSQDELPKITLSNQHMSNDAISRLHALSDCFVTASRGEAWNLPAFDAMLAGRHVITQIGLGSNEFLMNTSADLAEGYQSPAYVASADDGALTVRTQGAQGLTSRSIWLEPDLTELANIMRTVFEHRTRTITMNYDPAGRFGCAAVAKLALDTLNAKRIP